MLKSRGRTVETPVMGVEEWPQVDRKESHISLLVGFRVRQKSRPSERRGDKPMATKVQGKTKTRKVNKLRYAEYYNQQPILDGLYSSSAEGKIFDNLMPLILSEANILRAYRSMKSNIGSNTPGTDGLTIENIENLEVNELVNEICRRIQNYRPKAVRRKEIPKPNGKTRPLGIPCIWDRLIQQCILQILEPICEAKFSDNSYGFRPLRSTEQAIAAEMRLINQSKLHFVVEVDIKSFFDEVNHTKLMRQLWALSIRDKKLLSVIKAILKAPIRMPDGKSVIPQKGTPQGGILSPLLANVVLNELDHWIDSQWQENPLTEKYCQTVLPNGSTIKSGYKVMKKTSLKEVRIIRYADDVRILCRTRSQADKIAIATKLWLKERLKLQVSEEKTRIVNLKRQYSEFLGFKLKVITKSGKNVVKSHVCDKAITRIKMQLKEQVKSIQCPKDNKRQVEEICKFNAMVRGVHNYYAIATEVSSDFRKAAWHINRTIRNQLKMVMSRKGTMGKRSQDYKKYGKSGQLRYIGTAWILPLAYIRHRNPMCKRRKTNIYTSEGRAEAHDNLVILNREIMEYMSRNPVQNRSVEYNDNRVSLFAAQWGQCAVTGRSFLTPNEVHCHHKTPRINGGSDKYSNLVLVLKEVHILIHAKEKDVIAYYLQVLKLNSEQKVKLNKLRQMAGCEPV